MNLGMLNSLLFFRQKLSFPFLKRRGFNGFNRRVTKTANHKSDSLTSVDSNFEPMLVSSPLSRSKNRNKSPADVSNEKSPTLKRCEKQNEFETELSELSLAPTDMSRESRLSGISSDYKVSRERGREDVNERRRQKYDELDKEYKVSRYREDVYERRRQKYDELDKERKVSRHRDREDVNEKRRQKYDKSDKEQKVSRERDGEDVNERRSQKYDELDKEHRPKEISKHTSDTDIVKDSCHDDKSRTSTRMASPDSPSVSKSDTSLYYKKYDLKKAEDSRTDRRMNSKVSKYDRRKSPEILKYRRDLSPKSRRIDKKNTPEKTDRGRIISERSDRRRNVSPDSSKSENKRSPHRKSSPERYINRKSSPERYKYGRLEQAEKSTPKKDNKNVSNALERSTEKETKVLDLREKLRMKRQPRNAPDSANAKDKEMSNICRAKRSQDEIKENIERKDCTLDRELGKVMDLKELLKSRTLKSRQSSHEPSSENLVCTTSLTETLSTSELQDSYSLPQKKNKSRNLISYDENDPYECKDLFSGRRSISEAKEIKRLKELMANTPSTTERTSKPDKVQEHTSRKTSSLQSYKNDFNLEKSKIDEQMSSIVEKDSEDGISLDESCEHNFDDQTTNTFLASTENTSKGSETSILYARRGEETEGTSMLINSGLDNNDVEIFRTSTYKMTKETLFSEQCETGFMNSKSETSGGELPTDQNLAEISNLKACDSVSEEVKEDGLRPAETTIVETFSTAEENILSEPEIEQLGNKNIHMNGGNVSSKSTKICAQAVTDARDPCFEADSIAMDTSDTTLTDEKYSSSFEHIPPDKAEYKKVKRHKRKSNKHKRNSKSRLKSPDNNISETSGRYSVSNSDCIESSNKIDDLELTRDRNNCEDGTVASCTGDSVNKINGSLSNAVVSGKDPVIYRGVISETISSKTSNVIDNDEVFHSPTEVKMIKRCPEKEIMEDTSIANKETVDDTERSTNAIPMVQGENSKDNNTENSKISISSYEDLRAELDTTFSSESEKSSTEYSDTLSESISSFSFDNSTDSSFTTNTSGSKGSTYSSGSDEVQSPEINTSFTENTMAKTDLNDMNIEIDSTMLEELKLNKDNIDTAVKEDAESNTVSGFEINSNEMCSAASDVQDKDISDLPSEIFSDSHKPKISKRRRHFTDSSWPKSMKSGSDLFQRRMSDKKSKTSFDRSDLLQCLLDKIEGIFGAQKKIKTRTLRKEKNTHVDLNEDNTPSNNHPAIEYPAKKCLKLQEQILSEVNIIDKVENDMCNDMNSSQEDDKSEQHPLVESSEVLPEELVFGSWTGLSVAGITTNKPIYESNVPKDNVVSRVFDESKDNAVPNVFDKSKDNAVTPVFDESKDDAKTHVFDEIKDNAVSPVFDESKDDAVHVAHVFDKSKDNAVTPVCDESKDNAVTHVFDESKAIAVTCVFDESKEFSATPVFDESKECTMSKKSDINEKESCSERIVNNLEKRSYIVDSSITMVNETSTSTLDCQLSTPEKTKFNPFIEVDEEPTFLHPEGEAKNNQGAVNSVCIPKSDGLEINKHSDLTVDNESYRQKSAGRNIRMVKRLSPPKKKLLSPVDTNMNSEQVLMVLGDSKMDTSSSSSSPEKGQVTPTKLIDSALNYQKSMDSNIKNILNSPSPSKSRFQISNYRLTAGTCFVPDKDKGVNQTQIKSLESDINLKNDKSEKPEKRVEPSISEIRKIDKCKNAKSASSDIKLKTVHQDSQCVKGSISSSPQKDNDKEARKARSSLNIAANIITMPDASPDTVSRKSTKLGDQKKVQESVFASSEAIISPTNVIKASTSYEQLSNGTSKILSPHKALRRSPRKRIPTGTQDSDKLKLQTFDKSKNADKTNQSRQKKSLKQDLEAPAYNSSTHTLPFPSSSKETANSVCMSTDKSSIVSNSSDSAVINSSSKNMELSSEKSKFSSYRIPKKSASVKKSVSDEPIDLHSRKSKATSPIEKLRYGKTNPSKIDCVRKSRSNVDIDESPAKNTRSATKLNAQRFTENVIVRKGPASCKKNLKFTKDNDKNSCSDKANTSVNKAHDKHSESKNPKTSALISESKNKSKNYIKDDVSSKETSKKEQHIKEKKICEIPISSHQVKSLKNTRTDKSKDDSSKSRGSIQVRKTHRYNHKDNPQSVDENKSVSKITELKQANAKLVSSRIKETENVLKTNTTTSANGTEPRLSSHCDNLKTHKDSEKIRENSHRIGHKEFSNKSHSRTSQTGKSAKSFEQKLFEYETLIEEMSSIKNPSKSRHKKDLSNNSENAGSRQQNSKRDASVQQPSKMADTSLQQRGNNSLSVKDTRQTFRKDNKMQHREDMATASEVETCSQEFQAQGTSTISRPKSKVKETNFDKEKEGKYAIQTKVYETSRISKKQTAHHSDIASSCDSDSSYDSDLDEGTISLVRSIFGSSDSSGTNKNKQANTDNAFTDKISDKKNIKESTFSRLKHFSEKQTLQESNISPRSHTESNTDTLINSSKAHSSRLKGENSPDKITNDHFHMLSDSDFNTVYERQTNIEQINSSDSESCHSVLKKVESELKGDESENTLKTFDHSDSEGYPNSSTITTKSTSETLLLDVEDTMDNIDYNDSFIHERSFVSNSSKSDIFEETYSSRLDCLNDSREEGEVSSCDEHSVTLKEPYSVISVKRTDLKESRKDNCISPIKFPGLSRNETNYTLGSMRAKKLSEVAFIEQPVKCDRKGNISIYHGDLRCNLEKEIEELSEVANKHSKGRSRRDRTSSKSPSLNNISDCTNQCRENTKELSSNEHNKLLKARGVRTRSISPGRKSNSNSPCVKYEKLGSRTPHLKNLTPVSAKRKRHSSSRSPGPRDQRRSRSYSPRHRHRRDSRSHSRSRSPRRHHRSRSQSPGNKGRSQSPVNRSHRRSRTRSPPNRSHLRSRSRSPGNRGRLRSRSQSPVNRSHRRSRTRSPPNRSHLRSRSRSPGNKGRLRPRSQSPVNRSHRRSRTRSPPKRSHLRSKSRSPPNRSRLRSRSQSPPNSSHLRSRSQSPANRSHLRSRRRSPVHKTSHTPGSRKYRSPSPSTPHRSRHRNTSPHVYSRSTRRHRSRSHSRSPHSHRRPDRDSKYENQESRHRQCDKNSSHTRRHSCEKEDSSMNKRGTKSDMSRSEHRLKHSPEYTSRHSRRHGEGSYRKRKRRSCSLSDSDRSRSRSRDRQEYKPKRQRANLGSLYDCTSDENDTEVDEAHCQK